MTAVPPASIGVAGMKIWSLDSISRRMVEAEKKMSFDTSSTVKGPRWQRFQPHTVRMFGDGKRAIGSLCGVECV